MYPSTHIHSPQQRETEQQRMSYGWRAFRHCNECIEQEKAAFNFDTVRYLHVVTVCWLEAGGLGSYDKLLEVVGRGFVITCVHLKEVTPIRLHLTGFVAC